MILPVPSPQSCHAMASPRQILCSWHHWREGKGEGRCSNKHSTVYDKAGNAVKQTDAKGKFTTIAFDSRGRRKLTSDRITAVTSFTYTPLGQLASLTDAENQTTSYTYDARGSKLTEQYPDHTAGSTPGQIGYGIVTFVYDAAGRTLRKQDQQGDTVTFQYDLAGRMNQRDYRLRVNSHRNDRR